MNTARVVLLVDLPVALYQASTSTRRPPTKRRFARRPCVSRAASVLQAPSKDVRITVHHQMDYFYLLEFLIDNSRTFRYKNNRLLKL